jgi:6-phosphofructokinase
LLGARLGSGAVSELLQDRSNCMVGLIKDRVETTSFDTVLKKRKPFNKKFIELAEMLGN